jgi:hypothetical protein
MADRSFNNLSSTGVNLRVHNHGRAKRNEYILSDLKVTKTSVLLCQEDVLQSTFLISWKAKSILITRMSQKFSIWRHISVYLDLVISLNS